MNIKWYQSDLLSCYAHFSLILLSCKWLLRFQVMEKWAQNLVPWKVERASHIHTDPQPVGEKVGWFKYWLVHISSPRGLHILNPNLLWQNGSIRLIHRAKFRPVSGRSEYPRKIGHVKILPAPIRISVSVNLSGTQQPQNFHSILCYKLSDLAEAFLQCYAYTIFHVSGGIFYSGGVCRIAY